ncbi:GtrA family protein [Candidatus Blastococcus massiliensis]|uniref:GtrA family protein n=1 Tax=Candidatus Blastococcus massiliensis TaxID=1470358 RepID=UPI0006874E3F|nr:GtrA family protein [Candidatus Blastococcus massiliensis]
MSRSDHLRQAWRFLLVGGANTAVTVVLLAVLAGLIEPTVAYTVVYVLGLAFTTVMTSRYVFSAESSWLRMGAFVAWYLVVYAVGLAVVDLVDSRLQWSSIPLALATIAVTAPLSFLGGRVIFAPVSRPTPAQEISR